MVSPAQSAALCVKRARAKGGGGVTSSLAGGVARRYFGGGGGGGRERLTSLSVSYSQVVA